MSSARLYQTEYEHSKCEIGIIHIGYGAFHRAHQAVYLDDYMQETGDLRWGISAINLRKSESAAFRMTASSKRPYILKAIAPDGAQSFRLVRSHQKFVDAVTEPCAALSELSRPSVTAATITVTESGYYFADDWSLDLTASPIREDLSDGQIRTIYGFLSQALALRAEAIDAPISILCCDNIRGNGLVLQKALLCYLDAAGQTGLARWVTQNVTFPCSMVDRITPRATSTLESEISGMFPEFATGPVHAEAFSQWVLEDNFANDLPDLTKVGAQIVENVQPYEEAKIRILNGGHTALAYLGALSGHSTFDQAMRDPKLRVHFDRWQGSEVLKGLDGSIPFDTTKYLSEISNRFENPGIADQLERICMDGYSKMAIYIRPTLRACLQRGIPPKAGYDSVASWVVYARKYQAGTIGVPYVEPCWDVLEPMLERGQEHALASDKNIWGDLPLLFENFVPSLIAAIDRMEEAWPD